MKTTKKMQVINFMTALIFGLSSGVSAQTNTTVFEDPRDGRKYQIVQIEALVWFQDNLMFETKNSFYPKTAKKEAKVPNGNFYPYKDIGEVCPDGWRIPNGEEWNNYFKYRQERQNVLTQDIRVDTLLEEYPTLVYRDQSNKINLLTLPNELNLQEVGWVEGRKIRKWGTTTFWAKNVEVNDPRFHIHFRNGNYSFHRHQHNIDDVKSKSRKFLVKCVKSVE